MWIFSTCGFFSVTTSKVKPGMIQVRSRRQEHLYSLLERHWPDNDPPEILETPNADYRYRITITKGQWIDLAEMLYREPEHYCNFKDAVHDFHITQGDAGLSQNQEYREKLHDVWLTMLRLQSPHPWWEREWEIEDNQQILDEARFGQLELPTFREDEEPPHE